MISTILPDILDLLKEKNTKATFFIHTDKITDENRPTLQRVIDEGHTVGSKGMAQINYLYANNTYIESQVAGADAVFKDLIGYVPDIFQPSSRALDTRGQKILKDNGKTIVTWSAGANGWWFLDNGKSLEETVAALRYTLPEAGGMIQMPNDAEVLEEYFDQVWQYW